MPSRSLASVCVALACLCASSTAQAQSVSAQDMRLAYAAWPDLNPACVGHINVTFSRLPSGVAELAIGLDTTLWRLRSCDILIDTGQWVSTSRAERCVTLVHAIGHLALRRHEEGGVMASNGLYGAARYRPCERLHTTPRQRIEARLERHGWVSCGRWRGRVLPCVVTKGRKVTRYRARLVTGRVRLTKA
jgi:hypothetical protein